MRGEAVEGDEVRIRRKDGELGVGGRGLPRKTVQELRVNQ